MAITGIDTYYKDSNMIVETLGFDTLTAITASTYTISKQVDEFRPIVISRAAGTAVTLPASSGSGSTYRILIQTTVTSNTTTIKVANGTDVMDQSICIWQDSGTGAGTAKVYAAAANDDTITLNGTTTGGIAGCYIELIDYASGFWLARIWGKTTGTVATPFSATVS